MTSTPGNSIGAGDILAFRIGDTTTVSLVTSQATEMFPSLSRDGRWLAYSSNESGTPEVYVRPFPETSSAKWQVSTAGGRQPLWSSNGRELFFLNGKSELVAAEIRPGATFSVGAQRVLFSAAEYSGGGGIPGYAVSPDDRRFLFVREGEALQESELVVAQHWLDDMKRRVGE